MARISKMVISRKIQTEPYESMDITFEVEGEDVKEMIKLGEAQVARWEIAHGHITKEMAVERMKRIYEQFQIVKEEVK